MSSRTLNQNLIQVTRYRFVNAYLVREDDGFTLVDTTIGGGADELIGAAQAAGGEIRRIALTHGHGDHVGSVDALKQKLGPDVQVMLGELRLEVAAASLQRLGARAGLLMDRVVAPAVAAAAHRERVLPARHVRLELGGCLL